jgi:FkbM family methyltransferase
MDIVKKNHILAHVTQYLPDNPIIVEAGAFDGTDTCKMSSHWPKGIIHSFEPVPDVFALLEAKTSQLPNVVRHPIALSDHNGSATLYVSEKPSRPGEPFQAGTLLKPKERLKHSPITYPRTITVPTITLDTWAKENNIDHIDFMWLDLQGLALPVLKGGAQILKTVRALFVEVEFIEAYEGQAQYEEIRTWLERQGFNAIAQDFLDTTSWIYGNVFFVRK